MMELDTIRVLLVEDDEDDYFLVKELLKEIKDRVHELEWMRTYEAGLATMLRNNHDICLIDYRLGAHNGLDLLKTALAGGCAAPAILLTGMGQHEVDVAAMRAGAADYLVKGRLDANQLERSIRHAIERKRAAAQAAFEQARLAGFGAQVGLALMQRASLPVILEHCAEAMVQYLNGALTQIWVYEPEQATLDLRACAGTVFKAVGSPLLLPVLTLNMEEIAQGKPILIRSLVGDKRLKEQSWTLRENLVSFAAHPLMLEDRLVGLMGIYSSEMLTESVLQEMGSVANGIALCVQRKQAEEALDASEGRYRSVVENIKEVIFQMNEFGHWTFLNPAWTAITGFTVEEVIGTLFLDYFHHDERERGRSIFLQLVNRRLDFCRYETRLLTKEGKVRWIELYLQLRLDADGAILGTSGSLDDITERKQAEAQVQKLAVFPRVNPNPVLEFDADGTLSYANDAALLLARSLGTERILDLLPANVDDMIRACLAEGTKRLREKIVFAGRTITWSFFPVAVSRVVHCYGDDITEILTLEAQFRHSQKLDSVGQLAAGVAHDFNNLLTIIQGYSDHLLARTDGDQSLSGPLKQISDASRRAAALTRQLLTFSRKQVVQMHILDLNTILRNLTKMVARLLGDDIVLVTGYADDLPCIEADTGMIEQIVMNLAVNSRDAMPKGGRLIVTTSVADVSETHAQQTPDARAGRSVCLSVEDTGCGMDEETLGRIFEPFFSTKEVGRGTGLGLATVYGIVKQHQGWIEVVSTVGKGTTFKIFFPAQKATTAITGDEDGAPAEIRGGRETILFVEDEPVLRELAREVLGQYQYRILEASSGVEALKVWDEHDGRIDLLLTDMVMPEGMSGTDLAHQLRKRKPDLKVIYSSGYSEKIMGEGFGEGGALFLQKPYVPAQLAQKIRQCLDASANPVGEVASA